MSRKSGSVNFLRNLMSGILHIKRHRIAINLILIRQVFNVFWQLRQQNCCDLPAFLHFRGEFIWVNHLTFCRSGKNIYAMLFFCAKSRNIKFCEYINERVPREIRPVSHEHPQAQGAKMSTVQSLRFCLPSHGFKYFMDLWMIKYVFSSFSTSFQIFKRAMINQVPFAHGFKYFRKPWSFT